MCRQSVPSLTCSLSRHCGSLDSQLNLAVLALTLARSIDPKEKLQLMKSFSVRSSIAALTVVACMTGATFAQEASTQARPMFQPLKPVLRNDPATPPTPLTTWNGSFVYQSHTYKYNMVGTAPSTGKSTTIPVFLVPVVLKFTSGGKTTTFSPLSKLS